MKPPQRKLKWRKGERQLLVKTIGRLKDIGLSKAVASAVFIDPRMWELFYKGRWVLDVRFKTKSDSAIRIYPGRLNVEGKK